MIKEYDTYETANVVDVNLRETLIFSTIDNVLSTLARSWRKFVINTITKYQQTYIKAKSMVLMKLQMWLP